MEGHGFIPFTIHDGVAAGCSCGWSSAYTHAATKYALEDFMFHIENTEKEEN